MTSRRIVLGAVLFSSAVTVIASTVPALDVAYRSGAAHAALDTAAGVVALLAVHLVFGRVRRTGRFDELVVGVGLGIQAITNLGFAAAGVAEQHGSRFVVWAPLLLRTIGTAILAFGAFAPIGIRRQRRASLVVAAGAAVLCAATLVAVWLLRTRLPAPLDARFGPSHRFQMAGPDSILLLQLAVAVLFAAAAVGFDRRSRDRDDELIPWLAGACVLGAFARFNYFIFPSIFSSWVYTGDVLRLGAYALILVGAGREITAYQQRVAETAVLQERARLARDLHDGLAQDLAYISMRAKLMRGGDDEAGAALAEIATVADLALGASRNAITTLAHAPGSTADVLGTAALEVARRAGARVDVSVPSELRLEPRLQDALARIVREATVNAVSHGNANRLVVELTKDETLRLRIRDDGVGFDAPAPRRVGFGLRSMRERAAEFGGTLAVDSLPGAGTTVEVVVP